MRLDFGGALPRKTQDAIYALLPGLGFFGNSDDSALTIEVNMEIDEIELAIDAPNPEILNIMAIDFYDINNKLIPRPDICDKISLSTVSSDRKDEQFKIFCSGGMLHTKKELRPHININMRNSTFIKKIKIKNRPDIYGFRSRHLMVIARNLSSEVFLFKNVDAAIAIRKLNHFLDWSGFSYDDLLNEDNLIEFTAMFRKRVIDKIENEGRILSLREVFYLLPLYSGYPNITDYHISLCAHALLNSWSGKIVNTTFLKPFQNIISSDFALERLKKKLEHLIDIKSGRSSNVVIARHHIHESYFLERKDQFLEAINKITSVLEHSGITVMLGYGTLLGAVRNGCFLPHDDDVDLIVFDGSKTQDQAAMGKQRIIEILIENNIKINKNPYWHLHAVSEGMTVDLFPSWGDEGKFYLPMEQLIIRPVPSEDMLPTSEVCLYGRMYPAPANPSGFLENRYGPGWVNSDPYYEWPWKIDRITAGFSEQIAKAIDRRNRITRRHFGRICRVAWGQRVTKEGVSPPMNSLPIIDVAIENGYDAVELDVRITEDGVPILAHDAVLNYADSKINVQKSEWKKVSRFKIGVFEGRDVFVPTLVDALRRARRIDIQIDSRISNEHVAILRSAVDQARFDPARLQFCVYNVGHAQQLLKYFPESVLMWKTYRSFSELDDYFMDEARVLGMDGIMIEIPRNRESYDGLMRKLRDRNLRILMFIHHDNEKDLQCMVDHGVDYVTTVAHSMTTFKRIGGAL